MSLLEWSVPCKWCGAKAGEPCENNITGNIKQVYQKDVHRERVQAYDFKNKERIKC